MRDAKYEEMADDIFLVCDFDSWNGDSGSGICGSLHALP